MIMPYIQHQKLATRTQCRYFSTEERTSMLKEDNVAMPYKRHHFVVTRRQCRYSVKPFIQLICDGKISGA